MEKRKIFRTYSSTYSFVILNKLNTEATELFGINWEAEDDMDQIQQLIDYIGLKNTYVRYLPYTKSEEDLEVYYDEKEALVVVLREELEKYKSGFNEVMCYFDSISDEEKPLLSERLNKLGL